MRDLVAAMRGVADEARDAGVSDLRSRADEEVRRLESDAQRRQEELRQRAEARVGVGGWVGDEVLNLLQSLNRDHGKTIIMVTHDPRAAERARRTLHLEKGLLVEETVNA